MTDNSDDSLEHILELQRAYAEAVLAQGRLSPEIMEKYKRYCDLQTLQAAGNGTGEITRELFELAKELLPHLHFKMDEVNWRKQ